MAESVAVVKVHEMKQKKAVCNESKNTKPKSPFSKKKVVRLNALKVMQCPPQGRHKVGQGGSHNRTLRLGIIRV